MLTQALIFNHDTVKIRKVSVVVDKTREDERFTVLDTKQEIECEKLSSSTYFDDNKIKLGCKFGQEASYVIAKPDEVCDLFHVNQIEGAIIESLYGTKYF